MWLPTLRALSMLCALGVALGACSPARTVARIRLQFDPPPRVIFGPEDAARWIAETRAWICQGQAACRVDEGYVVGNAGLPYPAESYWRPSRAEVRRFERRLAFALEQAGQGWYRHDPPGALWEYGVRYIGYVRDGRRLIYAYGLQCWDPSACRDAADPFLVVLDGGTSVFRASFDPETGELFGPGFNGYA
jgi:hypothetical protein